MQPALLTATIIRPEALTQQARRYWESCSRKYVGRVHVIDPRRESMKTLRSMYGPGTIIRRASTGGKWGRSAQIVTL